MLYVGIYKAYLNSRSKFGPGCSKTAVLSEHNDPNSDADGELPALKVK